MLRRAARHLHRLLGLRVPPPLERLDMRLERNGYIHRQAPVIGRDTPLGGWRCADCGDHAVYLVTWPAAWAGRYCERHAPDPWRPGPPRVVGASAPSPSSGA